MANKHIAGKFCRLMDETGWSTYQLGERLHCDAKTVHNWRNAARTIPEEIITWLESVVAAVRAWPPPDYRELRPASGRPSRTD
jgi:ParB-like chromosome segregation protein Spo0J